MKNTRTERVVKTVVYQTVCDACGKTAEGEEPDGWANFSSYHHDWGSASEETWEKWDACSFGCYLAIVHRLVDSYGDGLMRHPTLHVDGKDWWFLKGMLTAALVEAQQS